MTSRTKRSLPPFSLYGRGLLSSTLSACARMGLMGGPRRDTRASTYQSYSDIHLRDGQPGSGRIVRRHRHLWPSTRVRDCCRSCRESRTIISAVQFAINLSSFDLNLWWIFIFIICKDDNAYAIFDKKTWKKILINHLKFSEMQNTENNFIGLLK